MHGIGFKDVATIQKRIIPPEKLSLVLASFVMSVQQSLGNNELPMLAVDKEGRLVTYLQPGMPI